MSVLNLFYANAKHCLVILQFLCSLENPTVAPSSGHFWAQRKTFQIFSFERKTFQIFSYWLNQTYIT